MLLSLIYNPYHTWNHWPLHFNWCYSRQKSKTSRINIFDPTKGNCSWRCVKRWSTPILCQLRINDGAMSRTHNKAQISSARQHHEPLTSPSGVSHGHNMPHCDGCKERGPLTLRVFSNCIPTTHRQNRPHEKHNTQYPGISDLREERPSRAPQPHVICSYKGKGGMDLMDCLSPHIDPA